MDLPDIRIVVQWRPTCGLSTLFQRFGRAARGRGQSGVGILLVDKKDLDDDHRRLAGSKRRNPDTPLENPPSKKRLVLTSDGCDHTTVVPIAQMNLEDALAKVAGDLSGVGATNPVYPVSMDPVECEKRYQRQVNSHGGDERMAKAKGRMNAVGTPMDDFINSHARGLSCQRMIACTFFGNDSRGKSLDAGRNVPGSNFVPKKAGTLTLLATLPAPQVATAVRPVSQPFAAISAHPMPSLNTLSPS